MLVYTPHSFLNNQYLGPSQWSASIPMAELAKFRSSIWSSETLVGGMKTVVQQPNGLLVKTEEDKSLLHEYAVS